MNYRIFWVVIFVSCLDIIAMGKAPDLNELQSAKVPPRIIRTCCSFGSDLKMVGIPLLKVTQITSLDQMGKHVYLGDESEGNGIIYTEYGGFIDLGHVRDQADWTAYLYLQLQKLAQESKHNVPLRFEGGRKR